MPDQPPPPPPIGPPADYFMTPPPAPAPAAGGGPGFAMPAEPPIYQAPAYPGSPYQPAAYQAPGYNVPPAYAPVAAGAGLGLGLASQFTGAALSSIVIGLVTIVVPFLFNWVFFVLPIAGGLAGLRAIQRGKMIGGLVGIGLNLIGGLITIIALRG